MTRGSGRPRWRHDAEHLQPPTAARVLLWAGGAAGLLLSIAGALASGDPSRQGSRILGAVLFGSTSVAALLAARLLSRRPRVGRFFGLAAAAGALFLGWLVAQAARDLPGALFGVGMIAAGLLVAWQLLRWRRGRSAMRE